MDLAEGTSPSTPPPTATVSSTGEPVGDGDRLESLDLVRGMALCGILMVNIIGMGKPGSSFILPWLWGENSQADSIAFSLVYTFISQKFYPIFSMLFGAGLALQVLRAQYRGEPVVMFLARRLGSLMLFGLLHGLLLWYGDILVVYALVGAVAACASSLAPRWLLLLAGGIYCIPVFTGLLFTAHALVDPDEYADPYPGFPVTEMAVPEEREVNWLDEVSDIIEETPRGVALQVQVMRHGTPLDVIALNSVHYMAALVAYACHAGWAVLAYMLGGMAALKCGWFGPGGRPPGGLLALGILLGLAIQLLALRLAWYPGYPAMATAYLLGLLASPLLAVSCLMLMLRFRAPRWVAKPLIALGRMAFSNYIIHSVIGVLLFRGWPGGYFGRWGYLTLTGLAIAILLVQAPASMLWMRRFRYGPLEWVWRCTTYRTLLPMVKIDGPTGPK